MSTILKGVSSMKIHRDLGIKQKTALYMVHRIRESWNQDEEFPFADPMEVGETYLAGSGRIWRMPSGQIGRPRSAG